MSVIPAAIQRIESLRPQVVLFGCMGGWCAVRDRCARYHASAAPTVSERLCERGFEQPSPMWSRDAAEDEGSSDVQ